MKRSRNVAQRSLAVTLALALASLISLGAMAGAPTALANAQEVHGEWTFTGSLNAPRSGHTATLLTNGKVLVAGGGDGAEVINTAELYDPDTRTWSLTGSLTTPRFQHTATLLTNGKVLVAGGTTSSSSNSFSNTAELYDLTTGTWSSAGNLNIERGGHTATLLHNGKVLAAGGLFSNSPDLSNLAVDSAELYDPDTDTWTRTADLSTGRCNHSATLLQNDRILVLGGYAGLLRWANAETLNNEEMFEPDSGTWSATFTGNAATADHTATVLPNGKVLVAGGYDGVSRNSAQLYDPDTRTWSNTGKLHTGRDIHTATLLANGKLLVAGGTDSHNILVSSEVYDQDTGVWSFTANMNSARGAHTATLLLDGRVLVAGGSSWPDSLDSAELYDPDAPVAIPGITGAFVSGKKLFVSGENFDRGAVILLNGEEQITKSDAENPRTSLISKKAGKKMKAGDKIQVRNTSGVLSPEFTFTGS